MQQPLEDRPEDAVLELQHELVGDAALCETLAHGPSPTPDPRCVKYRPAEPSGTVRPRRYSSGCEVSTACTACTRCTHDQ